VDEQRHFDHPWTRSVNPARVGVECGFSTRECGPQTRVVCTAAYVVVSAVRSAWVGCDDVRTGVDLEERGRLDWVDATDSVQIRRHARRRLPRLPGRTGSRRLRSHPAAAVSHCPVARKWPVWWLLACCRLRVWLINSSVIGLSVDPNPKPQVFTTFAPTIRLSQLEITSNFKGVSEFLCLERQRWHQFNDRHFWIFELCKKYDNSVVVRGLYHRHIGSFLGNVLMKVIRKSIYTCRRHDQKSSVLFFFVDIVLMYITEINAVASLKPRTVKWKLLVGLTKSIPDSKYRRY